MTAHPPIADRRPEAMTSHGHTREDPYSWLKDVNWQQVMRDPSVLAPDIRAYLEAENAYTEVMLAGTTELQNELFDEMKGRIKEDDSSVPTPDGPWEYYRRFDTGGQYPIFCRKPLGSNDEQILLNGDVESIGKDFYRIHTAEPSPDHRYLAYSVDEQGSEFYTIRVRELDTGEDLSDSIHDASGAIEWSADSASLVYLKLDKSNRPVWAFLHVLGTDQADDRLLYEESDPGFYINLGRTESGNYIEIVAADHETSEVRLVDAARPDSPPIMIAERDPGTLYTVGEQHGRLYINTNAGGAEDFSIVTAEVASPGKDSWSVVVPHRPGTLILGSIVFRRHLVRLETREGLPRIVIRDLASEEDHVIAMDEEVYDLGFASLREYTSTLRFTYSSPTTPLRVYDYELDSGRQTMRKEQEVPSGHRPDDYVTGRVFADGHDGERIPITLLYRKGTPLDGTAPCLLYGYGSYGFSMPASFSTNRLSLVDRGFVYAIAHVRGGKEGGYRWYTAGKRLHKRNTFLDFMSAANALVEMHYTSAGRIVIFGGSAGGLLVGVAVNMAPPGLLAGAIAEVPFVDVLTTMHDTDLPLTPMEWPEWGNPIDDADAYEYIASYSPYDNVEAREYPPLLVTAGLTDPRVTYWEPAKWVAKLRATKTTDSLLVMRTRMGAGHAGASGRFDALKELAEDYAFALEVTGKDPARTRLSAGSA
ncbi:MAG: S9 family peptidase [Acidimicrobiia bacterium]|nr:S9 family peptidase [Acidimicrobiia bacterium]